MAGNLGRVFGMYEPSTYATPRSEAYNKRYFENQKLKKKGKALGDIARKQFGVGSSITDFKKIMDDPEMNKKMFDPKEFDYYDEEFAPNDFEFAVMQDEANDDREFEDFITPQEQRDMETADMYQQMGEAGLGKEALEMMMPKSIKSDDRASRMMEIQKKRSAINHEMVKLSRSYKNALKSNNVNEIDKIKGEMDQLNQDYMALTPVGTMSNAPAYIQILGSPSNQTKYANMNDASVVQQNLNNDFQKLKNGEITNDEYRNSLNNAMAKGTQFGATIFDPESEGLKVDKIASDELRSVRDAKLKLGKAESDIFNSGLNNLGKFKVTASLDAYNKYLPIIENQFEDARNGMAGSQRAIVVAFNKLIEPSSAVMEGDFRSSGDNAMKSMADKIQNAIKSGDYASLGRKLSYEEITAMVNASRKIAGAMRNSIAKRVRKEEELIQRNMTNGGFTYEPNSFANYIGITDAKGDSSENSGSTKLNPSQFKTKGDFVRAGGTSQQWKNYMMGNK